MTAISLKVYYTCALLLIKSGVATHEADLARDRPYCCGLDLRVAQKRLRELVLASKRTNSVRDVMEKVALKKLTLELNQPWN